ncbi:MAG: flagellar export protein FliJ [Clostridiales bacterium]|jgi:flagellar FliJ protein|nr:flagellar export protein FliJ [Clostridiales bacterium]
MAKFRFRLQSVLSIKEKVEDLKKNEFGKAVTALAQAQRAKAEMEATRANAIEDFRRQIDEGINPAAFARYNGFIDKMKILIKQQEQVVAQAEAFVELKRQELVEAMRDRKTLETLRDNDFEEHLEEEKKLEQKLVDEIVSYKGSLT